MAEAVVDKLLNHIEQIIFSIKFHKIKHDIDRDRRSIRSSKIRKALIFKVDQTGSAIYFDLQFLQSLLSTQAWINESSLKYHCHQY